MVVALVVLWLVLCVGSVFVPSDLCAFGSSCASSVAFRFDVCFAGVVVEEVADDPAVVGAVP